MPTCPYCQSQMAEGAAFCPACGKRLKESAPEDATVRWKGPVLGVRENYDRQAFSLDQLFGKSSQVLIGRSPECDLCLPHPSISRRHALLERGPQGIRIRDLGSVNGVTVGGRPIREAALLTDGERVGVGPFLFTLSGSIFHSLDSSRRLRLEAQDLEKAVSVGGKPRKLLQQVSLVVEPGEFVSLLGPSGSGKSTLMDCLNGRRRATSGQVLANGEDFYRHFSSFRQSLGYVPQRDIVHTQLTVWRALLYTARLRLPPDTSREELAARVEEVVQEMELRPHRDTLIGSLSGGQLKRVSLGAELMARPCLLYIDEATSGLDAGTETRMMHLFRDLTGEGRSVVCITHHLDNVDLCHLLLVLARGRLVFYGPPREALAYFRVDRLGNVYDRLGEKEPEAWAESFSRSDLFQEFVAKRLTPPEEIAPLERNLGDSILQNLKGENVEKVLESSRGAVQSFGHQLRVLTRRYLELLSGDPRSVRLLLFQAPVVAIFVLIGFLRQPYEEQVLATRPLGQLERLALKSVQPNLPPGDAQALLGAVLDTDQPVVPTGLITDPRATYMLLAVLALAVFWFGCNNAAREIVKENAIYGRERAVNLGILPYLASKFLVLGVAAGVQVALLMLVVYGTLEVGKHAFGLQAPPSVYMLDFSAQFGVLFLLGLTATACGLLLSACVTSPDRANALLPYVLIPQIILGGGVIRISGEPLTSLASVLSPVYWAYQAICRGAPTMPPHWPIAAPADPSILGSCLAMVLQTVILLILTAGFLRRRDADQG